MTLSGSKQEATEDLGAEIQNVVVGKILSMKSTRIPTTCSSPL
jgi:phenylalanyl-tRNA synthetase beta chain